MDETAPAPALAAATHATVDAPAKINLALHVVGRRADGYHLLDSLVAFAQPDDGDRVAVTFGAPGPDGDVALTVDGPFAADVPRGADNIVVRAAAAVGGVAAVRLWKGLPVASGIGGGSADAAAVLRAALGMRAGPAVPGLLDQASAVEAMPRAAPLERARLFDIALSLGADVPVCLAGTAARMTGIGETLAPVALPAVPLVLVNPGVPVATAAVFAGLRARDNPPLPDVPDLADAAGLAGWLAATRNDLEPPAIALAPAVGDALAAVRATGCLIARMSGSGATVFGLYGDAAAQQAAAAALARPGWWVRAATLAG